MLQRVLHTNFLLSESSVSLVEIAIACGFMNQNHLTRVFSGFVGARWRPKQSSCLKVYVVFVKKVPEFFKT